MAYILGFFAADGTMIANNRGAYFIEFHVTDKDIILKIRKVLGSNHKISIRDRGVKEWKLGYRLQIGSKEMFNDLSLLGFKPNKSKKMEMPEIPTDLVRDFVRGYFDGDGCVYFKKHFRKDRNKYSWVFTTRFTCGTRSFLESLHNLLDSYVTGGYITNKQRGYELVFSKHDSLALYKLMYHTGCQSLYLNRKYRLFNKAIKTLCGSDMRS